MASTSSTRIHQITLTDSLGLTPGPAESAVEYVIGGNNLTPSGQERAAQTLADDAMLVRCGNTRIMETWRAKRNGTEYADAVPRRVVRSYAAIGFGAPDSPPNPDHLQGLVAELFWNRIVNERRSWSDGRTVVRTHGVKADPLEPGGDGLIIFKCDGELYQFRLWEIKKHLSTSRISATVRRASKQLASRGDEYLAKLAGPETLEDAGPLGDFYSRLIELWFDRSPQAGVGVSVGTSSTHGEDLTSDSLKSIGTNFPSFSRRGQTEAIIVSIPDFAGFADRVKEIVWSGL